MSGENYLGSSRNFENCPKMILNEFWRRANRIYICVAHGKVLKNKTYMWLEAIRIIKHG
jgi:hypothetical protein